MTTHKAYRLHAYGGPETIQLDDVPTPAPGHGQVLVAVSTVGMNALDWKIREGYLRNVFQLELPAVLGVDFVGVVSALGAGTSLMKVGERVMTHSPSLGAYAEHIAIDETLLARVPQSLSDIDAAGLPIPALTAWQALYRAGEVNSGMKVLIQGASGPVGAFAVQFAKAAGATVIGIASGKNREYVMSLGADEFIDYQTEKFENRATGIDLVLDFLHVGGSENTTDRSWSVLKPNGAIVSVADPAMLAKIPAGFRGFFLQATQDPARLEEIAELLAAGRIKSKIAGVFNRSELPKAIEINKTGGTAGRLIVDFKSEKRASKAE